MSITYKGDPYKENQPQSVAGDSTSPNKAVVIPEPVKEMIAIMANKYASFKFLGIQGYNEQKALDYITGATDGYCIAIDQLVEKDKQILKLVDETHVLGERAVAAEEENEKLKLFASDQENGINAMREGWDRDLAELTTLRQQVEYWKQQIPLAWDAATEAARSNKICYGESDWNGDFQEMDKSEYLKSIDK